MTLRKRLALLVIPLLLATTAACGEDDSEGSSGAESPGASDYGTEGAGEAARDVDPPPGDPVTEEAVRATIATDRGDIGVSLDGDKTPCAVNSFLSLAEQDYFDDTPCHRLVTDGIFVLQCGDPSGTGQQGPGYTVPDELPSPDPRLTNCQDQGGATICTYPAGTIAMAKGGDPSTGLPLPDSAGSQFFLVYKDSLLPEGYQVIGRMTAAGLKVVRDVAAKGAENPDETGNTAPRLPTTITEVKVPDESQ